MNCHEVIWTIPARLRSRTTAGVRAEGLDLSSLSWNNIISIEQGSSQPLSGSESDASTNSFGEDLSLRNSHTQELSDDSEVLESEENPEGVSDHNSDADSGYSTVHFSQMSHSNQNFGFLDDRDQ